MITDSLSNKIASITLAVSVLMLAGCADKANPDNVDKRAIERWNYLIAHQAEKAYDYLTPGVQATRTREVYAAGMNNRPVQWKAVKFNGKDCEADRCKVRIDLTYAVTMPGVGKPTEVTSTQSETWLLVKGAWYYLPNS